MEKCYPKKNKNCWSYMQPGTHIDDFVVHGHVHAKPVYFAKEEKTGREVVLKRAEPIYVRGLPYDPERSGTICLAYEAELQKRSKHKNICPVESVIEKKGRHYLVTPNLGKNLFYHLESGRIPTEERLMILEDIANAVDNCHEKGIIHLDIKERNVIVKNKQGILIDFGAAREQGIHHPVAGKFICATEDCGAPEYIMEWKYSPRSDTFSFCYMAFWTLTGKKPFKPRTKKMYSVQCYTPLSLYAFGRLGDLITQGLALEPGKRPQIKEIAHAIKEHTSRYRRQHDERIAGLCHTSYQQGQCQKTASVQYTAASCAAGQQPQPTHLF